MPMTTRSDRQLSPVERRRKDRAMYLPPDIGLSTAKDRHAHDRRLAAAISLTRSDRDHLTLRHRIGRRLIHLGHRLIADPAAQLPKGSSRVSL